LTTSFPVVRAEVTDLLERPLREAPTGAEGLPLALRPFQILPLRLRPA
jgi:alpha-mannosidase